MKMNPYKTVDEYLANFSGETRKRLDVIRSLCHEIAPETNEKISYGIPTMTLDDKFWVYFAGYENHISLYPLPHNPDPNLKKEIEPYEAGKGTLKFANNKPLPLGLIKQVIKVKHQDYLFASNKQ